MLIKSCLPLSSSFQQGQTIPGKNDKGRRQEHATLIVHLFSSCFFFCSKQNRLFLQVYSNKLPWMKVTLIAFTCILCLVSQTNHVAGYICYAGTVDTGAAYDSSATCNSGSYCFVSPPYKILLLFQL